MVLWYRKHERGVVDGAEYKWLGKVSEKKEINQEGNHEELKPCFELPAKTKENSPRGQVWQMSVLSWLSAFTYPSDFSDKCHLVCNVHHPGDARFISYLASWMQDSSSFLIKHHLLSIKPTWFLPTPGLCAELLCELPMTWPQDHVSHRACWNRANSADGRMAAFGLFMWDQRELASKTL